MCSRVAWMLLALCWLVLVPEPAFARSRPPATKTSAVADMSASTHPWVNKYGNTASQQLAEWSARRKHASSLSNRAKPPTTTRPGDSRQSNSKVAKPSTPEQHDETKGWICEHDPVIERLVHTVPTRTKVFILYHNAHTGTVARKFAFCKDWIIPIHLHRSVFMESSMYRDLLLNVTFNDHLTPGLRRSAGTAQSDAAVDFVIIGTYRHALLHLNHTVHPLSNTHIKQLLHTAVNRNADVVPLESYPLAPIVTSLRKSHGQPAVDAWEALLSTLGYNNTLTEAEEVCAFWRSSFLIRPKALQLLAPAMVKAMDIVENTIVQTLFQVNASYVKGDPHVAMQIFGTSYYQMHPFIFERLPAFLLSKMNVSVVLSKYNMMRPSDKRILLF